MWWPTAVKVPVFGANWMSVESERSVSSQISLLCAINIMLCLSFAEMIVCYHKALLSQCIVDNVGILS